MPLSLRGYFVTPSKKLLGSLKPSAADKATKKEHIIHVHSTFNCEFYYLNFVQLLRLKSYIVNFLGSSSSIAKKFLGHHPGSSLSFDEGYLQFFLLSFQLLDDTVSFLALFAVA